ncbi:MAG: HAMP domain-containing sensor histidine kinase [Gemmatimonadaceae bacterium]
MATPARQARRTRTLQVGFIAVLALCCAQLAYWTVDEIRYTLNVETRMRANYDAEVATADRLMRYGTPWREVAALHPNLTVAADSTTVSVSPAAIDALRAARFHRLNRYAWEGGFFLVVLLSAMAMVYRAVREEADFRRRQDEFLAAVTHELKSPLASLLLSTETLALRDPPPEGRAVLVGRLLADLDRLQRMITNVLATSRLSAPDANGPRETIVVADEVSAAVGEIRQYAAESNVKIDADVSNHLLIVADPEGVRLVFRNVLYNAIKATSAGGSITVRARNGDGFVRLTVRDDGVGFAPSEAKRLFEKFYRIESDGRSRSTGTGLGLFLVERYLARDGGTAAAASDGPGRGATFTLCWPAAHDPERA